METRTITTRLSAIALAVASTACAPQASRAQQPGSPPPEPPVLIEAAVTQPADGQKGSLKESQRSKERAAQMSAEARAQSAVARATEELTRMHSDIKAKELHFAPMFTRVGNTADQPTLITTQSLDAAAQAEMREDLTVMNKLVREEVARAGADAPLAMGIKLTMLGQSSPTYVEGAGVIFHATVSWPLAPVGDAGARKDDRPRNPASKWEIAKRQISGSNLPGRGKPGEPIEPPVFDQARFDALRGALVALLPEATNIRQLKGNESVFVTVQGIDEGGTPIRMTLKASKADVDAAAAGTINAGDFAQRVSQRIG